MAKKILVIDDEELLIRTMSRLLEKLGYEVYCVKSGNDAETIADIEEIDLIISDIRMPGRSGIDIVSSIMQTIKDRSLKVPPVIFITGYADKSAEELAERLKPVAYLNKPFDLNELIKIITDNIN